MGQIRDILSLPSPKEKHFSIHCIDFDRLYKLGMRTLLFDYDNTLAPWKSLEVDEDTLDLFDNLLKKGFRVCVVTNATAQRARKITERFHGNIPVFGSMRKPGIKKLKKVMDFLGSAPDSTVLTGDLFFTDIIAGNRANLYTILVNPYSRYTDEVGSFISNSARFVTRVSYRFYFYIIGWFFRMTHLISPNETHKSVADINFDKLSKYGFKAVIFDLDNTLTEWKGTIIPTDILQKIQSLFDLGYRVFVLSNTKHVIRFSEINKHFKNSMIMKGNMKKPFPYRIKKILKEYNINTSETIFVGDQYFTDIFAGNLLFIYTIKVSPLNDENEFVGTKFLRFLEKLISNHIKPKPYIKNDKIDNRDEDDFPT